MIEKFTKEEIAILVKELKNLPKDCMKRDLLDDEFHKLRKVISAQKNYDGIYYHDIEDAILTLADITFCNYEESPMMRNRNLKKFRKSILVRKEFAEQYKEFVGKVVDLMDEYLRTNIVYDEEK